MVERRSARLARLAEGPVAEQQWQEEHRGPVVETRQQRRLSNEAAKGALPLQRASVLGVRSSSCDNISAGSRANQPQNKADFVPDIYRVCGAGSDHAGDGPNAQSSVDSCNVSDSAELSIGRMQPSDSPSQEEKLSGTALIGARVKVWWGGDCKWFTGVVDRYDAMRHSHHVRYADGDQRWHELDQTGEVRLLEKWRLLERPCAASARAAAPTDVPASRLPRKRPSPASVRPAKEAAPDTAQAYPLALPTPRLKRPSPAPVRPATVAAPDTAAAYPLALPGDVHAKKQRFGARNQDLLLALVPAATAAPPPTKKAVGGGGRGGGGGGAPKLLMPPPPAKRENAKGGKAKGGKANGGKPAKASCTALVLRRVGPAGAAGAAAEGAAGAAGAEGAEGVDGAQGAEAVDSVEELKRVGKVAPQWSSVPLPAKRAAAQEG